MAATNKCLAQSNKSPHRANATKKRTRRPSTGAVRRRDRSAHRIQNELDSKMTFPKAIACVLAGGVMLLASGAYQKAQAQSWGVYNRIGKQTPRNYKEP